MERRNSKYQTSFSQLLQKKKKQHSGTIGQKAGFRFHDLKPGQLNHKNDFWDKQTET